MGSFVVFGSAYLSSWLRLIASQLPILGVQLTEKGCRNPTLEQGFKAAERSGKVVDFCLVDDEQRKDHTQLSAPLQLNDTPS